MALVLDGPALESVRCYLDDMMYSVVDLRLSFEVGVIPTGFPSFRSLQEIVKRLDPVHQVLFRLFRLGEAIDEETLRRAVPERIATALAATSLLVRASDNGWRTPSLLLVPVEGMVLVVSVPAAYPTASGPQNSWFDLSSYVMAKALPGSLAGRRVLDVCSGSGLQGLLCAARGATHVVGLELNREAAATAEATAILNRLGDRVEFRQSDLLSSLKPDERFDFVVCNSPYAPVIEGAGAPSSVEQIGNSVIWRLLDLLPRHLSEGSRGILGSWRAAGHRAMTYQMQAIASRLAEEGFMTTAFVDPAPDTVEGVLRILKNDLEQRLGAEPAEVDHAVEEARRLLQRPEPPVDGFYNQLISFRKIETETAAAQSIFGLIAPPPVAV